MWMPLTGGMSICTQYCTDEDVKRDVVHESHKVPAYHWICLTNRFQVAVRLSSNRSQMTSKYGKNQKVAHEVQPSVSLVFLQHFDVLCELLLNRRTAIWNLFVLYNNNFI